jgi:hypothetical protein
MPIQCPRYLFEIIAKISVLAEEILALHAD